MLLEFVSEIINPGVQVREFSTWEEDEWQQLKGSKAECVVFAVNRLVPGHEILHSAEQFLTEVNLRASQFYKSSATGVLWYSALISFPVYYLLTST